GLYYDKSAKKLYIKFSDTSKDPNKISMLISNQENFELYDVNGLTIANLSMQGSTRCINIDASSNINIEGINCFGGFFGISVKTSKNIKITKNIVYMKRGNFAYNDMKNKPYETTGIYLQNNYDGIVVKNNEVYGHFNGILTYSTEKGKFLNADISYNKIYDIYDDAIEIENYCNGARYHHNDIRDTFVGISLSPADASEKRCFVSDNLIIAEKKIKWDYSGTVYQGECFKIIDPIPTQNFNYSRNTCIGRAIYSLDYEKSTQKNSIWENNIFYSKDQKLIMKSGLSSNGIIYDYNLYFRADGGTIFQYWNSDTNSNEFSSLEQAKNSNLWDGKWDRNSKNLDPLFNDISKNDFRPKENSPACTMSSTGSYVGAFPCINTQKTPYCGDGICNNNENCNTCSKDCGSCSNTNDNTDSSINQNNTFNIISCVLEDKSIEKNTNLTRAYDLKSCFKDPLNKSLSYTVIGAKNIKVVINFEAKASLYPNSNWVGEELITFKAFDPSTNRSATTNKIKITVFDTCGNNKCESWESCSSCSKDCGQCETAPYCGDNICNNNEDCNSCSKDCGQCIVVESNPKSSGSSKRSGGSSSGSAGGSFSFNYTKLNKTTELEKTKNQTNDFDSIVVESNKKEEANNNINNIITLLSISIYCLYKTDKTIFKKLYFNSKNSITSIKYVSLTTNYKLFLKHSRYTLNHITKNLKHLFINLSKIILTLVYNINKIFYSITINLIKSFNLIIISSGLTIKRIRLNKIKIPKHHEITNSIALNLILPIKDRINNLNISLSKNLLNLTTNISSISNNLKFNRESQETRMINIWFNYIKEYEKKGYSNQQIKKILTKDYGYDETLINYILTSYYANNQRNKVSSNKPSKPIITSEIRKEWHKYFNDCERIGFSLKEIKEFLLFEKGYDKSLVETLINDYQTAKYIQD
ncbi:MAG: hypothetical protein QW757_04600, partial [Candidatus Woesearchaeota archaeon]